MTEATPYPLERNARPRMSNEEFEQRLRKAGLSKVKFAELTGMRRENVIRWGHNMAPAWAATWLILYAAATSKTQRRLDLWIEPLA